MRTSRNQQLRKQASLRRLPLFFVACVLVLFISFLAGYRIGRIRTQNYFVSKINHSQNLFQSAGSNDQQQQQQLQIKNEENQLAQNGLVGNTEGDPELQKILEKIAINGEVLVALSDHKLISADGQYGMLKTFIDGVKYADVKNTIIVALDDQVAKAMDILQIAYWRKDPIELADKNLNNHHVISGMKYYFIKEFLKLGYSILLTDVDVMILRNPFQDLHRDCDVESMSDGFDEWTAYGHDHGDDDPDIGWGRYAHAWRIYVLNAGFFYLKPNERTMLLMDRITQRLAEKQLWDQVVFNEEIWAPSNELKQGAMLTVRVMDIFKYSNSKTFWKRTLHGDNTKLGKDFVPTVVHVNYHPEKWDRMVGIWMYYVEGDKKRLLSMPYKGG